jgi:hypothetical protein
MSSRFSGCGIRSLRHAGVLWRLGTAALPGNRISPCAVRLSVGSSRGDFFIMRAARMALAAHGLKAFVELLLQQQDQNNQRNP